MGEVFVSGEKALDFLQYITTNDVSKLTPGKIQYTCLPNAKGGIVDDFLLYMITENNYLLVVNASNMEKDLAWINKHNTFGCNLIINLIITLYWLCKVQNQLSFCKSLLM